MTSEDFCRVFCAEIALIEVPIGFVFRSPFKRPDGDAIAVYLRKAENGTFRLEDDGQTMGALEVAGFDLDSESRTEALADILREHDAFYDENESLLHTLYLPESSIPIAALGFAVLLARLPDLALLATNRIRSTFRADLIELVRRQFGRAAAIDHPWKEMNHVTT